MGYRGVTRKISDEITNIFVTQFNKPKTIRRCQLNKPEGTVTQRFEKFNDIIQQTRQRDDNPTQPREKSCSTSLCIPSNSAGLLGKL